MDSLISEKIIRWLLPVALILFVLEVITFPIVLGFTYSGRSEAPNHLLTYSTGKLTWDNAIGIDSNGSAILDLFDYIYQEGASSDVISADGENVVAPGTSGFNIVRLKNSVKGSIKYNAVLYRIRTSEMLSVEASLDGTGFTDTASCPLPAGVDADQVIRAVSGTVEGGAIRDFDISWFWQFYVNDSQDIVDTLLGNKLGPDEVTVGLYIVVEDNNSYAIPEAPETGDDSHVALYVVLMIISFLMLVLLVIDRRKELQQEKLFSEDNS